MNTSPSLYCIELRTRQWRSLVDWYRDALGLRVLVRDETGQYALVLAGETLLAIVGRKTAVTHGDTHLVFETADLSAVLARLRELGQPNLAVCQHEEGYADVVASDPDGNRVRLIAWPETRG